MKIIDNEKFMETGDTVVLDGQWWVVVKVDDEQFLLDDDSWDYIKDYTWVKDASLDDGGYWEANE
jgi:hypothetical protein